MKIIKLNKLYIITVIFFLFCLNFTFIISIYSPNFVDGYLLFIKIFGLILGVLSIIYLFGITN